MSRVPKVTASPFDGLLGVAPARLPKTAETKVVVAGREITDLRQLNKLVDRDDPDYEQLRLQVKQAQQRARYQRARRDPEAMAKRKARELAAREGRREYMRQCRAENRERINALTRAWAKRKYHADPLAAAQKQQEWRQANPDKVRAISERVRAKKRANGATQQGPAA